MNRSIIKVNGVNLLVRDTGQGDRTLVCLHGRWGRGETWSDFIGRYKDRYRIVAPDQRGHGLSDKPEEGYAMTDYARDIHELIQKLGIAPAVVVGHSMGARVAGYLTALYPNSVRAVALLDETGQASEKIPLKPGQTEPVDDLTGSWPLPFSSYDEAVVFLTERFRLATNVRYFLESLIETPEGYRFMFAPWAMGATRNSYENWHYLLPKIKCPVMLMRGKRSWCLSQNEAAEMARKLAGCMYVEVESDHMVYADAPEDFYAAFEQFLAENRL